MSLYRLIYSSQASPNLTPQDLQDIQEVSEKNNPGHGITGLLCYGNQIFLQVLEGDCEEVSKTYHRIAVDQRHHSPVLIECVPIQNRTFEVWSMQTIKIDENSKGQIKNLVLKHSCTPGLNPNLMTPKQCLSFMEDLSQIYQLSDNFFLDL